MINSFQVSSMIAAQQQQFAAAMDYSYQSSMGYAGNIGTYGLHGQPMMPPPPMAQNRQIQPIPYSGPNTPGFSYGQPVGYGLSNMIGPSAVSNSMSLAGTAISLSSGVGAFRAARASGAGLLSSGFSGAMAFSPIGMAAGLGFDYAGAKMYEGAQEQQAIYGTLGSNSNFVNSASRTGRGFGRQEAKAISDFAREMQGIPEAMTSMSELNRIMSQMSQMGIMHGARSAQEFNRRFKENLGTLKEISKVVQGTMEEGLKYLNEAKQSGFYSPQGIKANVAQRMFTAGITGLNQDQLGALQQSGSQMAFATGGYRRSGANMMLRTARQVGVANEMGILTNEQLQEMTGVEGPEAIAALSENLAGASHRMSRSGFGTALSIAVAAQDERGTFTGGTDEDMIRRVRSGGIGKEELIRIARQKTRSRNSKLSFSRQRDRIRSEMASSVGVEGMTMELQELLGERGWQNPDALNLVMQRFGVDERTASAIQKMGANMTDIQSDIGIKSQTEARRQAEQAYRGEFSFDAIKRKFSKKIDSKLTEPLKKLGADMSHSIETYVDDYMDSLLGRYSVEISKSTAGMVAGAMVGDKSSQTKLANAARGMPNSNNNSITARHSYFRNLLAGAGSQTQEQEQYEFLKDLPSQFRSASFMENELTQSGSQEKAFRETLGKTDKGIFRKELIKAFDDMGEGGGTAARGFRQFMFKNNAKLADMSQIERMNFMKSEGSEYLYQLQQAGASPEEAIMMLQRKSGTTSLAGSLGAGDYIGERYGTGSFASAETLGKAQSAAIKDFSDQFGDKASEVEALMGKDSKEREFFLKLSSGDPEAQKLVNEKLSPHERDELAKKLGISEEMISSMRSMYSGAGGKDVSKLAGSVSTAIARTGIAAEASQLRRQGLDIKDRLSKSTLGDKGSKLSDFANKLAGLDTTEKMVTEMTSGNFSSDVRGALDLVRGLKGNDKEQALDVLGPGARSALEAEHSVMSSLKRRGGIERIREAGDDTIKQFIDQRHGKLSQKDKVELSHMVGERKFTASLSAQGSVAQTELNNQKQLAQELTKFVEANTKFAQVVFQNNPELQGAQGVHDNVQGSGNNIIQRAKKWLKK